MSDTLIKEALNKAIQELEQAGDIVVVTNVENKVANKLHQAIGSVTPNMLSTKELSGIINAINAHNLGFSLGENDFQTIIGLTKEELNLAADKLKAIKG